MKMKAVLTAILCLVIFAGCGYKMALPGAKSAFTLYVNKIDNKSDEVDGQRIFNNEILSYLASIDANGKKNQSAYIANFSLDKVTLAPAVKLKSGQTATVDMKISMTVSVKDKSGNIVFEKTFTAVSTYSQAYSLSSSLSNREKAIREAIRAAMDNFRYAFENR